MGIYPLTADTVVGTAIGTATTAAVAALSVAGTLYVQSRTFRNQANRDRVDRQRSLHSILLLAAQEMHLAATEPLDTRLSLNDQVQELMLRVQPIWDDMKKARAEVLLDPDGHEVVRQFESNVLNPFTRYRLAVGSAGTVHDGAPPGPPPMLAARQELDAGFPRFRSYLVSALQAMERARL